jgi:hypothetical protein
MGADFKFRPLPVASPPPWMVALGRAAALLLHPASTARGERIDRSDRPR